jgi:hypothetical protein
VSSPYLSQNALALGRRCDSPDNTLLKVKAGCKYSLNPRRKSGLKMRGGAEGEHWSQRHIQASKAGRFLDDNLMNADRSRGILKCTKLTVDADTLIPLHDAIAAKPKRVEGSYGPPARPEDVGRASRAPSPYSLLKPKFHVALIARFGILLCASDGKGVP